jgi:RNA polymerase sigma factor (sigma-70 family)
MAHVRTGTILQHLRKLTHAQTAASRRDAELLERFAAERDPAAFAALMARHGPLVLGLCRRILRHTHDAEDACQATFLVLARRAGSIRKGEALGSWLYGVAYRIACKACKATQRRRQLERRVPHPAVPDQACGLELRDLQTILDHEINRLPEKYRAAFVLCCLKARAAPTPPRSWAGKRARWPAGWRTRGCCSSSGSRAAA